MAGEMYMDYSQRGSARTIRVSLRLYTKSLEILFRYTVGRGQILAICD